MKISHVLRGDDHISNTPKQLMVYEAFGWEPPVFGHMTLIFNENRKKLSKRDESIIQFIEQYEQLGYIPEALFNFIALLGWSPVGEEEIFTKDEFIEIFDASRLSKAPAIFDKHKLLWVNNQYMKKQDLETVIELTIPHLVEAGRLKEDMSAEDREWATKLVALYQEKLSYGAEIVEQTDVFFKKKIEYEEEALEVLKGETVPEVVASFKGHVEAITDFSAEEVKAAIKATQKETKQKGKNLFMPIRVATTGQTHGPDLPQAISLFGKEEILKRLDHTAAHLA